MNQVKLICVVSDKTYKAENGNEYNEKHYFLELENGTRIAVKPCFKDDYKLFSIISEKK